MSSNSDSRGYELSYPNVFPGGHMPNEMAHYIPYQSVYPQNAAIYVAPPSSTTGVDHYAWVNTQPTIPNVVVLPSADPLAHFVTLTNAANTAPVVAGAGQAIPSITSAPTRQNNPPTCPHCGDTHRRPVLYRACHNKHLGLRPFVCAGECGNPSCVQTFASRERKMAHTRGRVTCDKCGKPGWKKNEARHRASCSLVASD